MYNFTGCSLKNAALKYLYISLKSLTYVFIKSLYFEFNFSGIFSNGTEDKRSLRILTTFSRSNAFILSGMENVRFSTYPVFVTRITTAVVGDNVTICNCLTRVSNIAGPRINEV